MLHNDIIYTVSSYIAIFVPGFLGGGEGWRICKFIDDSIHLPSNSASYKSIHKAACVDLYL